MNLKPIIPVFGKDELFKKINEKINEKKVFIDDYFMVPGFNEFVFQFRQEFFKNKSNLFLPENIVIGTGYSEDAGITPEAAIYRTKMIMRSAKKHGAENITVFFPYLFYSRQELSFEDRDKILENPHRFIEDKLTQSNELKHRLSQNNNLEMLLNLNDEERIKQFPDYAREIERLQRNSRLMIGSIDSLNMLIEELYHSGMNQLITVDVHNQEETNKIFEKIYGTSEDVFYNINTTDLFSQFIKQRANELKINKDGSNIIIPALDKGCYERVIEFKKTLGYENATIIYLDKEKSLKSGKKIKETHIVKIDDPLKREELPKNYILLPIDDIGDTFSSLVKMTDKVISEYGSPSFIVASLSHAIMGKGTAYEKISENNYNVVVTNSRPNMSFHYQGIGRKKINVIDLSNIVSNILINNIFNKNYEKNEFQKINLSKTVELIPYKEI